MDAKWIATEKGKLENQAQIEFNKLTSQIKSFSILTEKDTSDLIDLLGDSTKNPYFTFRAPAILKVLDNHEKDDTEIDLRAVRDYISSIDIDKYASLMYMINGGLDRYLDSDPVHFDGDILITDPCYIMRTEHHGTKPLTDNDWDACDYGEHMEVLGIAHFMTRDTLYGDWGCSVYNTDSKEKIGNFCADAGLVSVMSLGEVLKYNPDFDYHTERQWTSTVIPDFSGSIQFIVEHEEGVYEEDTQWWKAGDKWEDYSVHVVGHGINKKTGQPINFYSSQTSA